MKYTLLEIVQHMLSDAEGDEVNSIYDTVESAQIVSLAERVFFEIIGEQDQRHTEELFQLTPSGDVTKPTHMTMEDNVESVLWIKYNNGGTGEIDYETVRYCPPKEFCEYVSLRNSTASDILQVLDASGVTLLIKNDTHPSIYTSFDDETIVFDSYDASVDSTLQNSKLVCFGRVKPSWSNLDTFVPDLPENLWPRYLAELGSRYFYTFKEQRNPGLDNVARRFRIKAYRDKNRTQNTNYLPDYGRKRP